MKEDLKKAAKGWRFIVILLTGCTVIYGAWIWLIDNWDRVIDKMKNTFSGIKRFLSRKKKKFSKYEELELEELD